MPIYEYACTACDHRFEELVSASGSTLVACPRCSSGDVEKLLSVFASTAIGRDEPRSSGGGGCCGGSCGCRH
jgi:putative FmdB family regulatory protein